MNDALGAVKRATDAVHASVAAEIARESRPELGGDGLAKKAGYRTPVTLIAATVGTTSGDAARLVSVGEATAPRMTLTGQSVPARHPHVADALAAGCIGVPAASAIVSMLDRIALRADPSSLDEAERSVVEQAPQLSIEQLGKLLLRVEAHLDPDGVEPREDELRTARTLTVHEDRTGAIVVTGRFDPENGAPIIAAIDAYSTAAIRRRTGDGADTNGSGDGGPAADVRSIGQVRADALTDLCRHMLGCGETTLAHATTTVVVRMDLEDLERGVGFGTIDGLAQPVSADTVRRMAASGNIIPCVLGSGSEILDWGRTRRLFSTPQRLALVERDGGCAFCGLPPAYTEAHHIRWWLRDTGATDLANGILLCTRCHHRIHADGWGITIGSTPTGGASPSTDQAPPRKYGSPHPPGSTTTKPPASAAEPDTTTTSPPDPRRSDARSPTSRIMADVTDSRPVHFVALVFPGITQLDLTGPLQVFAQLPDAVIDVVWHRVEPIATDSGFSIVPSTTFADAPQADVLMVPGGQGALDLMDDAVAVKFVRRQAGRARYVTSVCTGAFVLGAAGLLRDRRATTHWASHSMLALLGATPERARVVRDGNLITGGGVTSGIDFGLRLAAEIYGADTAKRIQLAIEYNPQQPFDAGSPSSSDVDRELAMSLPREMRMRREPAIRRAASRLRGHR